MRIIASVLVLLSLIPDGYGKCSSNQKVQDEVVIQSPGYPKEQSRHSCKRYRNTYTSPPGSTLSIDCPDFTIQCRDQNNYLLVTGAEKKCGKSFPKVTTSDNVLKVEYGARYNRAPDSSKWNVFKFKCQIKVHKSIEHFTSCDCPGQGSALSTGVTSGTDAEEGEFPYMVAIMKDGKLVCGGSLITDKWVVTSVFCGVKKGHKLKMGFVSLTKKSPNEETRNVRSVEIHVNFHEKTQIYNLALVELDEPVLFTPFIRPICLPDELQSETLDNELVTVIGWGTSGKSEVSDVLQKLTQAVVDKPTCMSYHIIDDQQYNYICTVTEVKDSCKHDDGGPLAYTNNGKTYLVGVASFIYNDECAVTNRVSYFTKISSHAVLLWIRNTIEEHCETPSHTPYSCDVCGKRMSIFQQARIYGGEEAAEGEFPYQAKIVHAFVFHYCGGSLISDEWVVTSVNCDVRTYIDQVILGDFKEGEEVLHHIYTVLKHPQFNYHTAEFDIALIKLITPVAFTDYILPICLPDIFTGESFVGKTAVATGWGLITEEVGFATKLRKVTLDIVDKEVCYTEMWVEFFASLMCGYSPGKGTCQGDTGGPLAYQQLDRFYLIGVTSFSVSCHFTKITGAYTKVHDETVLSWIKNTTGINCSAP